MPAMPPVALNAFAGLAQPDYSFKMIGVSIVMRAYCWWFALWNWHRVPARDRWRVALDVRIGIDGLAETSFHRIDDPFLSFLKALERGCFHKLYSFEAVATCLPHMLLDGIFMR